MDCVDQLGQFCEKLKLEHVLLSHTRKGKGITSKWQIRLKSNYFDFRAWIRWKCLPWTASSDE